MLSIWCNWNSISSDYRRSSREADKRITGLQIIVWGTSGTSCWMCSNRNKYCWRHHFHCRQVFKLCFLIKFELWVISFEVLYKNLKKKHNILNKLTMLNFVLLGERFWNIQNISFYTAIPFRIKFGKSLENYIIINIKRLFKLFCINLWY